MAPADCATASVADWRDGDSCQGRGLELIVAHDLVATPVAEVGLPAEVTEGPVAPGTGSLMRGARRALIVRAATLPVVAAATLASVRVTISALGVQGYGVLALVIGLAALIPFSDLGVGAAVTDAVARRGEVGSETVLRIVHTSLCLLAGVGMGIAVVAWGLAFLGAWAPILGTSRSVEVEIGTAAALSAFALGLPLALSSRILLGAERFDIALVYQAGAGVITLLLVLAAAALRAPLWAYTTAPFAAANLTAAAAWPAAVSVSGLHMRALPRTFRISRHDAARVAHLAAPMLVISIALPIAYQSDRLILSHVSNLNQVTIYALGYQLFTPLLGLLGAAGISLWPVVARRRANRPVTRRELAKVSCAFMGLGIVLAGGLLAVGPRAAEFVSKGQVDVSGGVLLALALLLVVYASFYPTSMFQTDRAGLRFQAATYVVMMVINVSLSIVLASKIGAAGPILSSALSVTVALWIPGMWRAMSRDRVAN